MSTQTADFAALEQNEACVKEAVHALAGSIACWLHTAISVTSWRVNRASQPPKRSYWVNFTSVVSLLIPIANHLEQAKAGSLGVITSVAGDRGGRATTRTALPRAP
ncbi:MAG: hypothetical protein WDO74_05205 [Pseudomonadota bacterium]